MGQKGPQQATSTIEKVTGVVTNPDGEVVPKVTIYLLGSNKTVFTDDDGAFSITADKGDELIFAHPRYIKKSVTIESKQCDVLLNFKDGE